LRDAVREKGPSALAPLWTAAAGLVRHRAPGWRDVWSGTVEAGTRATDRALVDLAAGTAPHLADAAVRSADPRPEPRRYG
ncbi:hypothetical protein ACQUZK_10190, partial [Streptococcus pyogenes]|uniref:hypothetical protein n=1 Tax=Streptococcus pyogenes TaxID=1314 RepID=UPI003D9FF9BC